MITLGIIGVVAAMTLPTLIQNHQKQTYVNQLKKVVNTLNNGMQMAVAQEDASSFASTSAFSRFWDLYGCGSDCAEVVQDMVKYFNLKYVSMDTSNKNYCSNYKNFDGSTFCDGELIHPVYTSDGAIIYMNSAMWVDVNGTKGPNQVGRDTFIFDITGYDDALAGSVRDNNFPGRCVNESQYLENGCYYTKIVADGWKMNY